MLNSATLRQSLPSLMAGCLADQSVPQSLEEAERDVEQLVRLVADAALQHRLTQMGGRKTHQGTTIGCSCGGEARFVGYRKRHLVSLWGEAQMERAYYYCRACRKGQAPWDEAQSLNQRSSTPALKARVAEVMAQLPYHAGCRILSRVSLVELEESVAEQIVEEVGQRLRAEETQRVDAQKQRAEARLAERLMVEEFAGSETAPPLAAPRPVCGRRLYISLDGAMAHLEGDWREVKCGLVYTVEADEDGIDTLLQRSYLGVREDVESFGWRLAALGAAWNADAYEQQVAIGDGAHSNWALVSYHFPRAVQILDFLHASQHLSDAADAAYGVGTDLSRAWWKRCSDQLKQKGPDPVLAAMQSLPATDASARAIIQREYAYVQRNRDRMDYPGFRARGMMIGSGPIEATCKVLVGQRLKQSGMRWRDKGADAILAVRARLLGEEFDAIGRAARAA
jgi:hypothetical protein